MLTGSVDKLIDFISVSNTTPNPCWPDIHMFIVQRISFSHDLSSDIFCLTFLNDDGAVHGGLTRNC